MRRQILTTYNEDYKSIGQRIMEARDAKKWPRKTLALKMGYSSQYVWQIETGKYLPSMKGVKAFEKALKIKLVK